MKTGREYLEHWNATGDLPTRLQMLDILRTLPEVEALEVLEALTYRHLDKIGHDWGLKTRIEDYLWYNPRPPEPK